MLFLLINKVHVIFCFIINCWIISVHLSLIKNVSIKSPPTLATQRRGAPHPNVWKMPCNKPMISINNPFVGITRSRMFPVNNRWSCGQKQSCKSAGVPSVLRLTELLGDLLQSPSMGLGPAPHDHLMRRVFISTDKLPRI